MAPNFDAMPPELRALPRWVVWKGAKIPFNATALDSPASVNDPNTWSTFDQAVAAFEEGGYLGVGFVLNGDGIVGVDFDKCVSDGVPSGAAIALMKRIGCTHIELSPSGTGLRGFGMGASIKGCRGNVNGVHVELYSTGRYLTVTGHSIQRGALVPLIGFAEVATEIRGEHPTEENRRGKGPTEENRRNPTEDDFRHLPFSSVGELIKATQPTIEGERNKALFSLARRLKGQCPDATTDQLQDVVEAWHRRAHDVIGTKEFSVTWYDFMRGWEKVRMPHGHTLASVVSSIDFDVPMPESLSRFRLGACARRLLLICAALQRHEGDRPFFISSRQAGELVGLNFSDAAKILGSMVDRNLLVLISKGAGNVASRYRFNVPELL